ncbi:MAG: hypothetical protein ACR2P5_04495 [Gammaproteobacteria bacterium]
MEFSVDSVDVGSGGVANAFSNAAKISEWGMLSDCPICPSCARILSDKDDRLVPPLLFYFRDVIGKSKEVMQKVRSIMGELQERRDGGGV